MKYKFKSKDKNELATEFNLIGNMDYMLKDGWYVELSELPEIIHTTMSMQPDCNTRDYSWIISSEDLVPIEEEPKVGDMVMVSNGGDIWHGPIELLAIVDKGFKNPYICQHNSSKEYTLGWKYIKNIVKPTCEECGIELKEIATNAEYVDGSFCSSYCAEKADFRHMLREVGE